MIRLQYYFFFPVELILKKLDAILPSICSVIDHIFFKLSFKLNYNLFIHRALRSLELIEMCLCTPD